MMKNNVFLNLSRCLFALIMAFGFSMAVQAQQGLLVKSSTGAVTSVSYKDVSKLTFVNEIMTLVSPAGISGQSYALATVASVTFGDVTINAIDEPLTSNGINLYPTFTSSSVNLQGAAIGAQVAVYSMTGSVVMQLQVASDLQSINVRDLKAGIYLLRVNGKTFKFSKQ